MPETAFASDGSKIRWLEIPGREPARVFVHGLGGIGPATFAHVAEHPALAGHRTLIVDLPGHGLSDRPKDWDYSLEGLARAVAAACDAAAARGIDLIGHSLGGDTSIVAAYRYPGLVARLVVAEGNLDALPRTPAGERASQRIAAQTEEDFVERGYDALFEAYPSWVPTLRLSSPIAVYRCSVRLVSGTTPPMREMLTSMSIPRTFIVGDRGEPLLGEEGLRAAGVDVIWIADAGHGMMHDQPEAFVTALAAALPDVPPDRG